MFCPNCGKELPDSARFCSGCGKPVGRPQEQPSPPPVSAPPVADIPGTESAPVNPLPYETPAPAAGEAPVGTADETPAGTVTETPAGTAGAASFTPPVPPAAPATPAGGGKKLGRIPLIAGIAVVVVALIAVVAFFLPSLGRGGSIGPQVYVYLTDDNELMFLKDLNEKTEAVEFSDEATGNSRVAFSRDGKYIYYIEMDKNEYSGNLYRAEVSKLGKDGESPLKITNSVSSFTVLENGDLIYRKERSGETQIYLYSGEESYKLTSDVYWFGVDAGEDYGYYTEYDNNGAISLYRIELKPDGEKETVVKRADNIFSSYISDVLLYGEADGTDANYNTVYTLYSIVPGGDKERLMRDVSSVMGVTAENGKLSFYYTTCQEETFTLYDFVSDSMKNSDAGSSLTEPVYPSYYDDYYPWYLDISDDGREYYVTYSGLTYYLDYDRYPYMGSYDIAYSMANDLYNEAMTAYDEQYNEWYAINRRNNLRDSLSGETYTITSYTLYRYADGESTEIASRMTSAYPSNAALAVGVCFYNKAPGVDGKLADLADLEYYYDIYNLISDSYSVDYNRYYLNVSGNESEFELEDDDMSFGGIYVISDTELAISVYDYSTGEENLLSYSIGKDTLTYQDDIAEDYYTVYTADGKLYYYTDWDYNRYDGDLYCYSDGKSTRIASEIHTYYEVGSGAAQYILTEWEYDTRNDVSLAELAMLDKDGKAVRISDEVVIGRIWFLDEQKVMYISDSDLYYWDGKETRRVASDVEYLWLSQQESYVSY